MTAKRGRPAKSEVVTAPPSDPGQVHTRGRWYKCKRGVGKLVSVNRELLNGSELNGSPANRYYYEYGLKFTDANDEIMSWWRHEELVETAAPRRRARTAA